jgi:CHAT domain-containing protein/tetratricopeptide (TPR) repeat protein
MQRELRALVLAMTLASACRGAAADEPEAKPLTPAEQKELEAKYKEYFDAGGRFYQARKLAEATEALEKALATARRLCAGQDHPRLPACLHNLGLVLAARNQLPQAQTCFTEAVAINRRLYPKQDHAALAAALANLGGVLGLRGKFADAEPCLGEALAMHRRLYARPDDPNLVSDLYNLAHALGEQGKYVQAEPLLREALAIRRRQYPKQDHPLLAGSLTFLAQSLVRLDKLADAEELCRESLAMRRRLYPRQDHPAVASAVQALAIVLGMQGRNTDAEPLYREALAMRRRLSVKPDNADVAGNLHGLALMLMAPGQYGEAEALAREALAMNRRLYPLEDHVHVARSLDYLSLILWFQERYADAEPFCREQLAMYRRLYPQDHPDLASSLHTLVLVLKDSGKYAEAETLGREALAMSRRMHPQQGHTEVFSSLTLLATLLRQQGNDKEAEPLFREALGVARRLAEDYAALRSVGEALHLAINNREVWDQFLSQARALEAEAAAIYPEVWAAKSTLARVYERRALAARAAAANPKAAALLEQLTERRWRRADLLLAPQPADLSARRQRDDALQEFAQQIETLDRALRPLLPALDRSEKLRRATPTDLQRALPADSAVVDFVRYRRYTQDPAKPGAAGQKQTAHYLAFVVTKDRLAWCDLGPARPLEDAVTAWREAIASGKPIPPALPNRVRELAWTKVRTELPEQVKVVYIAPDLALCRVPWAALPADRPNRLLLEDYAIAVIPHAPFLLDTLWPPEPLPKRPDGVLVIGGVTYDTEPPPLVAHRGAPLIKPEQKLAWASLPGAAAEAKGVSAAAAKKKLASRLLDGDQAHVSAVLAALPRARYAHLATHGFFADASFRSAFQVDTELFKTTWRGKRAGAGALSPMVMTGLVFAGANRPETPGRGILTGEALVDLDLSGLELAVLSACETGLGDVAGGEGTFGLQRAFHLAGTRDVIASLWKVPDRPTAALMALFYQNLWNKDLPHIEALRQAQLEIYRHPERIPALATGFRGKFVEVPGSRDESVPASADGKAHPQLWAAFTLSGPGR